MCPFANANKEAEDTEVEGLSLESVAQEARRLHKELGAGQSLESAKVLELLSRLHTADMTQLLKLLQSSGRLSRGELSMLDRARATGHALTSEDEILIENKNMHHHGEADRCGIVHNQYPQWN